MTTAHAGFNAPRYYDACLGPVVFHPFAAELVRRVPRIPAGTVLELACGTGAVTRPLRAHLPPAAELVATDLSAAMLAFARDEVAADGIAWECADMMALPFAAGRFAAAVCGFGVMFPPDRQAALAEARRVLAPGASFVFTLWDGVANNAHARGVCEAIEARFPDDPEMRFRTPYDMNDVPALRAMLDAAGFADARIETVRLPIAGADPQRIAAGMLLGTPRAGLIAQRGVDPQELVAEAAAALARLGGDPFHAHAQALVVTARAPS